MRVEWSTDASVIGAGSSFATRLAEGPIRTLHHIPISRVIRLPETGDTVEVRTKIGRWIVDEIAWAEVIAPWVPIDGIT